MKGSARRHGIEARARAFAPLAVVALLACLQTACAGLPKIDGAQVPPDPADVRPVYRDLADIPDPPSITPLEMNEGTIQALTQDRAKTAQAAQGLRGQPFDQPDSVTPSGF